MQDSNTNICPYTGLRSFTEDESIYFKGRDEHIEIITRLLERNKFLMVAGASGDGKSSLVFAGLIPNARAGFFKARFNNWAIVHFRPERSPLSNLAKALAPNLGIESHETVESTLSYGFSSLVDLYLSSPLYIDYNAPYYLDADPKQRKSLERKAGNLLIFVDQFEEFFTNQQNFLNGKTSNQSQLAVNLLLETAKLALEQNLPIYIVSTMRSDYIGQCTAYRGLAEYIGFSHYFVPRLRRKELIEVIEEPAILAGLKISRRLVERLLYDLNDGEDQLPILQHALSETWKAADRGNQELDLIHYAMIGGLPSVELPESNQKAFKKFRDNLPTWARKYYFQAGMLNVLDLHATRLYMDAPDAFNAKSQTKLPDETIHKVLRTVFTCLTRMDEGRIVRNRMSLREIADVLGQPEISPATIGAIIHPYREFENTFVRPFLQAWDEDDFEALPENTVLDITHESLIRNWKELNTWARQKHEDYLVYTDLERQMMQWLNNDKQKGYLLAIGPLTFLENWFENTNITNGWIAQYDNRSISYQHKLLDAANKIRLIKQFLEASSRGQLLTRFMMNYGGYILPVVLGVLFLGWAGQKLWSLYTQRTEYIVETISEKGTELLKKYRIDAKTKAEFLLAQEGLHGHGYCIGLMDNLPTDSTKIETALQMVVQTSALQSPDNYPLINLLIYYADTILANRPTNFTNLNFKLKSYSALVITTAWLYQQTGERRYKEQLYLETDRVYLLLKRILDYHPDDFTPDVKTFFRAAHYAVTACQPYKMESRARYLARHLDYNHSNSLGKEQYNAWFKNVVLSNEGYKIAQGGIISLLPLLYATTGNLELTRNYIDTCKAQFENYISIQNYGFTDCYLQAIKAGHTDIAVKLAEFAYGDNVQAMTANLFFNMFQNLEANQCLGLFNDDNLITNLTHYKYNYGHNRHLTSETVIAAQSILEYHIYNSPDNDAKNEMRFTLALLTKNQVFRFEDYCKSSPLEQDRFFNRYLDSALKFYRLIDGDYLDSKVLFSNNLEYLPSRSYISRKRIFFSSRETTLDAGSAKVLPGLISHFNDFFIFKPDFNHDPEVQKQIIDNVVADVHIAFMRDSLSPMVMGKHNNFDFNRFEHNRVHLYFNSQGQMQNAGLTDNFFKLFQTLYLFDNDSLAEAISMLGQLDSATLQYNNPEYSGNGDLVRKLLVRLGPLVALQNKYQVTINYLSNLNDNYRLLATNRALVYLERKKLNNLTPFWKNEVNNILSKEISFHEESDRDLRVNILFGLVQNSHKMNDTLRLIEKELQNRDQTEAINNIMLGLAMANAYPDALAEKPELTSYQEELGYITRILEVYLCTNGEGELYRKNYQYQVSLLTRQALDNFR